MGKRPSEADLGIETTPEEQEILSRPVQQVDDDIRPDEEDETPLVIAKPELVVEEKPVRVKDPATGKFVAKEKADEPGAPPDGFVDKRALKEARDVQKRTEAENRVLMERMTALLEIQQRRETKAQEPDAPVIPDRNVDPLGFIDHLEQRLGKIEGETAEQAKQRQAAEKQATDLQQFRNTAIKTFQEAATDDAQLTPAFEFLSKNFAAEAEAYGLSGPQLRDHLDSVIDQNFAYAMQNNIPLGEFVKRIAASRGWNPQQQPQPQGKSIAERQQQQQRHMSMSDMPGSATPQTISAKDIAKMTPKEFAAFARKMGDSGLDELFSKV